MRIARKRRSTSARSSTALPAGTARVSSSKRSRTSNRVLEASPRDLADVYAELGDKAAATAAHVTRLKLLKDDAAKATTPKQAQVHDYARLNSLLALGRGDDAVALFQQRVWELPGEYEPWARLASTFFKLDRCPLAAPVVQQAIALSYGTRRLRYRLLAADIAHKLNDVAGERAALQALVQEAATLPPALADAALAQVASARLDGLAASGP